MVHFLYICYVDSDDLVFGYDSRMEGLQKHMMFFLMATN